MGRPVVRPFWPGGDFEHFDYPADCVVIDNPPFSIISKVVKFYAEHNIEYFLFAPHLTCLGIRAAHSHICVGVTVTYDNGAKVNTSFVASKGPMIRSAPDLYRILDEANVANIKAKKAPPLPVYIYPDNVLTSSSVALLSHYGVDYSEDIGVFVRAMDAQREAGKVIFGGATLYQQRRPTRHRRRPARHRKKGHTSGYFRYASLLR